MLHREQYDRIKADLCKKMVILVGPRQAGKTFLSQRIAKSYQHPVYLNYDRLADRKIIENESWLPNTDLLILDEVHKWPMWKNRIKGIYDTKPKGMHMLVTGSARLETYRHAGDSLAGRYLLHHLLPLSPLELSRLGEPVDLDYLIEHSGFPEPYLMQDIHDLRRWRQSYVDSLLTVDVLAFDKIQNHQALSTLFSLLQTKVGSPISYSALGEDIGISPTTVKKYISILESLYLIFLVTPFAKNIARSLLKEPKVYFFDAALVQGDDGVMFENLVASSLYKQCHIEQDTFGLPSTLHYLRTKDKKEVDFALTQSGDISRIIEVKHAKSEVSKQLTYFAEKYTLEACQVVKHIKREYMAGKIPVLEGKHFLTSEYMQQYIEKK